ncbi:hypothetical protein U1Q18_014033 [Sarracenia purpurea var. burkii]
MASTSTACQEMKEENGRSLSDLPDDLLSLILSNLFARDYITFRAVCKSWNSISTIPRPLKLPIDFPLSQCPYLMFFHGRTHSFNFFHPICNAAYQTEIPELSNVQICFSKNDWLLMSQGFRTVFFFNPFTKARIDLPDIPEEAAYGFISMCFSSPPTSPDCVVVGFTSVGYSVDIGTFKFGGDEWTVVNYDNGDRSFQALRCPPVLCNGSYYFLGDSGELGVYDPTDDEGEGSWDICGKPSQKLKNSQQGYIVESDGDLLSVFIANEGSRVYVLKRDFSNNSWRKVESLGDKMLYLCIRTSLAETAMVKGAGNKIYLPMFYGNEGVFYSLATRKFHCFSGTYCGNNLYDTKHMKHCAWVKPHV